MARIDVLSHTVIPGLVIENSRLNTLDSPRHALGIYIGTLQPHPNQWWPNAASDSTLGIQG